MALRAHLYYTVLACARLVTGQLNPLFLPNYAPKQLQSALPVKCPNNQPRADIELPSPLPAELQGVLSGLASILNATVDPSFPALSGKPQAAALQLDYRGSKLTSAFVGEKDPRTKSGVPDETTIFRIGSISKIFPVLMLYQLYDRGVVSSLDDPLSKYAPGFELPNVYSHSKRQFTLRQLASQLSGMARELPCNMFQCNLTSTEILARMKKTPGAQFQEYTQPSYSNAAYSLLGNLLADYIQMPFAEYVNRNILKPLGMHSTGFVFTDSVEARMAKSYSNVTRIPNTDLGYVAPAGQMYSNIKDLMSLGRYFLGISGDILDDGLRKELLMPGFIWRDGRFLQGAPWEIQLLKENWLMLGKGGNVPGYSAVFGIIPQLNLSLAGLWSGAFDETSFVASAYEHILPEFVSTLSVNAPAPVVPENPSRYIGVYRGADPVLGAAVAIEIAYQKLPSGNQALALMQQGVRGGWLNFHDDTTAVAGLNGADFPATCFLEMAAASIHIWIVFDMNQAGTVTSFEMPGEYYGVKFLKDSASLVV